MDSEEAIFQDICSQVESSQWRTNDGNPFFLIYFHYNNIVFFSENKIRKRQFAVECPHDERPPPKNPALSVDVPLSQSSHTAIMAKLDAIQERQDQLYSKLDIVETRQLDVDKKVAEIQSALSDKMPERGEFQAQSKLLRECRVLTARVQQSVSRITGDMESEESTDLATMIPMSSVELVQAVETKLKNKAYADAMIGLLARAKGTKGTVDGVMRGLFKDDTVANFNLEGRAGKFPLVGLKVTELLFG
ncbi:uncharacterized protein LOC118751819 [Rhagoletis pomonella]|uniref:uncharacterized protein LOC118751819 n=1 Tax=Rhagoletis pomonella TaxID=28610 RepID=UPI0017817434|nr:uncharacterized protein LOC118751819 [Rhagoletis pomonella]